LHERHYTEAAIQPDSAALVRSSRGAAETLHYRSVSSASVALSKRRYIACCEQFVLSHDTRFRSATPLAAPTHWHKPKGVRSRRLIDVFRISQRVFEHGSYQGWKISGDKKTFLALTLPTCFLEYARVTSPGGGSFFAHPTMQVSQLRRVWTELFRTRDIQRLECYVDSWKLATWLTGIGGGRRRHLESSVTEVSMILGGRSRLHCRHVQKLVRLLMKQVAFWWGFQSLP